jgi:hypothetical protein
MDNTVVDSPQINIEDYVSAREYHFISMSEENGYKSNKNIFTIEPSEVVARKGICTQ